MGRLLLIITMLLCSTLAAAAPLSPQQLTLTRRWVQRLQNEDGGFRFSKAPGESQLEPTRSALRTLKLLEHDGNFHRHLSLFILSCHDPMGGGFADIAGARTDVRSTAMGIMALVETNRGKDGRVKGAFDYLLKHAKTPQDMYVSLAAMEAAGFQHPSTSEWLAAWEATRTPEGTYGKSAFDNASAVVSILRLGGTVQNRDAVLKVLREGQLEDGSYEDGEGFSGLVGTYRVVRAFRVLKEKPEIAKVRAYVNQCRNEDHGYGPRPDEESTASTTYYAVTLLHWLDEMEKG